MTSDTREWVMKLRVRYRISKLSKKTSVRVRFRDTKLDTEKHYIICLGRLKSDQLSDKDLVVMLITTYMSVHHDKQEFKKKYRDAELLHRNSHEEVFKRLDEIIVSSELFR